MTMAAADWLKLARATGMHGHRLDELLSRFGDPAGITSARAAALVAAGLSDKDAERILATDDADLRRAAAWLDQPGNFMLTWADPGYPALLRTIPDPPVVLFGSGNPDVLCLPQLAIVGSRKATAGGVDTARRFAAHMARAGLCITSGLALGIDAAAHGGALQAQGITIAVCGTGPDQVYPPGTTARPAYFPQRNRIISGLSLGTLVVEAGVRSGALITAREATDLGIPVGAVPGAPGDPRNRGNHKLLRQGAHLVENIRDVIETLSLPRQKNQLDLPGVETSANLKTNVNRAKHSPLEMKILEILCSSPLHIDNITESLGIHPGETSAAVLELELQGLVEDRGGKNYSRVG